ncbi:MAG: hypothetical protein EAZ37_15915 [Burkholderiales bacterium]|nr:MAG: hypothetical protein EAZ37_15915 [Burkholderiales bacterium]
MSIQHRDSADSAVPCQERDSLRCRDLLRSMRGPWLALGSALILLSALHSPQTVAQSNNLVAQICTTVRTNNDSNLTEGSTAANPWRFDISFAPSGTVSTTVVSTEASGRICASNVTVPNGSTSIRVVQNTSRTGMNWLRDAVVPFAYPRLATSGALTGAEFSATSGDSGNIALPSGTTGTLTLDYFNGSGRRVEACSIYEDNGQLPLHTNISFAHLLIPSIGGSTEFFYNVTEGGPRVCDTQQLDLHLGATTLAVRQRTGPPASAQTVALNYPRFSIVATATNTEVLPGAAGYWVNNGGERQIPPASITGVAGDLRSTTIHRNEIVRKIRVCKTVLNGAVGEFNIVRRHLTGDVFNSGANSGFNYTAVGAKQCQEQTVSDAVQQVRFAETSFSDGWTGNAVGFPKMNFLNYDGTPNANISGDVSSNWRDIDFSTAAWNGITDFQVHVTNSMAPFGQSDGNNTTGDILRMCKTVGTDTDTSSVAQGNFLLSYAVYPTAANFPVDIVGRSTGLMSEGQTVCKVFSRYIGYDRATIHEALAPTTTWPGWANLPTVSITNGAGGAVSGQTNLVTIRPTHLDVRNESWTHQHPSVTEIPALPDGDYTATFTNNPGTGRRVRHCLQLLDNGLAPARSFAGGVVNNGIGTNLTLTEGAAAQCSPYFFVDPRATRNVGYSGVPADWMGHDPADTRFFITSTNGGPNNVPLGSSTAPGLIESEGSIVRYFVTLGVYPPVSDITLNWVFKETPSKVCKKIVNNGDFVSNNGTFPISLVNSVTSGLQFNPVGVAVTEGGAAVCRNAVSSDIASWNGAQGPNGTLTVSPNWEGQELLTSGWVNSSGYPRWEVRNDATNAVIASGSGTRATYARLASTPTTLTFLNRTGAPRRLSICTKVESNGTGPVNSGGAFGLEGFASTGTFENTSLTRRENSADDTGPLGSLCSTIADIPVISETVRGVQTPPALSPDWRGSATGFPKWTLYGTDALGAPVVVQTGTGNATPDLDLAGATGPLVYIVFENRPAAVGELQITKTLTGAPAGGVPGLYNFSVSCTGNVNLTATVTLAANSTTGVATVSGMPPVGASCSVAETARPNAPTGFAWNPAGFPAAIVFTVAANGNSVEVVNPLTSNGTLTVSKTITGAPQGFNPATASFGVFATCTLPAAGTRYPATGTVAVSVTTPAVITGIPNGAQCTVVEDTSALPTPPTGFGWGTPIYTQPTTVIAAGQNTNASVANPLAALVGTLTVSKTITGAPQGYTPASAFAVFANCSLPTAGTRYPTTGTVALTTGTPAVISNIPAGATCTVTEDITARPTPPAGFGWNAPTYVQPANAVTANGNITAAVTNPLSALNGTLTITKTITGAPQGYTPATAFAVFANCSLPTAGTRYPTTGTAALTTGTPAVISNIPAGATCTVTEDTTALPAPPTGFGWSAPTYVQATGPIIAAGNITAAVTNAVTPLDPPFIVKSGRMIDATTAEWTITVINNAPGNATQPPIGFVLTDPLPEGFTFIAGSVACTPTSVAATTTVATCAFNAGNNRIDSTGQLAYTNTAGANAATAPERVTIVFRGTVAVNAPTVRNTACIANAVTPQATVCAEASITPPTEVPINQTWLLWVMLLGVIGAVGLAARRRSGAAR